MSKRTSFARLCRRLARRGKIRLQPAARSRSSIAPAPRRFTLTHFAAAFAAAVAPWSAWAAKDGYKPNAELFVLPGDDRVLGGAAGLMPFSLFGDDNQLSYAELRAVFSDEDTEEYNLMLGHRLLDSNNTIWGGYIAYDRRRSANENTFDQWGLGVEMLTPNWDFRANYYDPIDDEETLGPNGKGGKFQGNQLFADFNVEEPLGGFDVEVGRLLNFMPIETRVYLSGHSFDSDFAKEDADGYRAELELRPLKSVVVGVSYEHDDLFGEETLLNLRYQFGLPAEPGVRTQHERMTDFVRRDVDVRVTKPEDAQKQEMISDKVIHIDNANDGEGGDGVNNGDGSFEDPYNSFNACRAGDAGLGCAVEDSLVYVHQGDGTGVGLDTSADGGGNTPFELVTGQQLIGQGIGLFGIGGDAFPMVNSSTGPAVTLTKRGNEVAGLDISSSERTGEYTTYHGDGGIFVLNNTFSDGAYGSNFDIHDNRIHVYGNGIEVRTINGNTSGAIRNNVVVGGYGDSSGHGIALYNIATGEGGFTGTSRQNIRLADNAARGSGSAGLYASNRAFGSDMLARQDIHLSGTGVFLGYGETSSGLVASNYAVGGASATQNLSGSLQLAANLGSLTGEGLPSDGVGLGLSNAARYASATQNVSLHGSALQAGTTIAGYELDTAGLGLGDGLAIAGADGLVVDNNNIGDGEASQNVRISGLDSVVGTDDIGIVINNSDTAHLPADTAEQTVVLSGDGFTVEGRDAGIYIGNDAQYGGHAVQQVRINGLGGVQAGDYGKGVGIGIFNSDDPGDYPGNTAEQTVDINGDDLVVEAYGKGIAVGNITGYGGTANQAVDISGLSRVAAYDGVGVFAVNFDYGYPDSLAPSNTANQTVNLSGKDIDIIGGGAGLFALNNSKYGGSANQDVSVKGLANVQADNDYGKGIVASNSDLPLGKYPEPGFAAYAGVANQHVTIVGDDLAVSAGALGIGAFNTTDHGGESNQYVRITGLSSVNTSGPARESEAPPFITQLFPSKYADGGIVIANRDRGNKYPSFTANQHVDISGDAIAVNAYSDGVAVGNYARDGGNANQYVTLDGLGSVISEEGSGIVVSNDSKLPPAAENASTANQHVSIAGDDLDVVANELGVGVFNYAQNSSTSNQYVDVTGLSSVAGDVGILIDNSDKYIGSFATARQTVDISGKEIAVSGYEVGIAVHNDGIYGGTAEQTVDIADLASVTAAGDGAYGVGIRNFGYGRPEESAGAATQDVTLSGDGFTITGGENGLDIYNLSVVNGTATQTVDVLGLSSAVAQGEIGVLIRNRDQGTHLPARTATQTVDIEGQDLTIVGSGDGLGVFNDARYGGNADQTIDVSGLSSIVGGADEDPGNGVRIDNVDVGLTDSVTMTAMQTVNLSGDGFDIVGKYNGLRQSNTAVYGTADQTVDISGLASLVGENGDGIQVRNLDNNASDTATQSLSIAGEELDVVGGEGDGLFVDNDAVYGTADQGVEITGLSSIIGSDDGVDLNNNAGIRIYRSATYYYFGGDASQRVNLAGSDLKVVGDDNGLELSNNDTYGGTAGQYMTITGLSGIIGGADGENGDGIQLSNRAYGNGDTESSGSASQTVTLSGQDLDIVGDDDGIYGRNRAYYGGTANQYLTVTGLASVIGGTGGSNTGIELHNTDEGLFSAPAATANQTVALSGTDIDVVGYNGISAENDATYSGSANQTLTIDGLASITGTGEEDSQGIYLRNYADSGESAVDANASQTVSLSGTDVTVTGADGIDVSNDARYGASATQDFTVEGIGNVTGVYGFGIRIRNRDRGEGSALASTATQTVGLTGDDFSVTGYGDNGNGLYVANDARYGGTANQTVDITGVGAIISDGEGEGRDAVDIFNNADTDTSAYDASATQNVAITGNDLTISGYRDGLYIGNRGRYGGEATQTVDVTGLSSVSAGRSGVGISNYDLGVPEMVAATATQTVNLSGDGFTISANNTGLDQSNAAAQNGSAHQMVYLDSVHAIISGGTAVDLTNRDYGSSRDTAEQHLTITGQDLSISSENGDGINAENDSMLGGNAEQYLSISGLASISGSDDFFAGGDGIRLRNYADRDESGADTSATQTVNLSGTDVSVTAGGGIDAFNYARYGADATQTFTFDGIGNVTGSKYSGIDLRNRDRGEVTAPAATATQTVTLTGEDFAISGYGEAGDRDRIDWGHGLFVSNDAVYSGTANQYVTIDGVGAVSVEGEGEGAEVVGIFNDADSHESVYDASATQDVTITGNNLTISVGSGSESRDGLEIDNRGHYGGAATQTVDVTGLSSVSADGTGVIISNHDAGLPAAPAATAIQTVNLSGDGFGVTGAGGDGLDIENGARYGGTAEQTVDITGVTAINGDESGVSVSNLADTDDGAYDSTATQNVTVTGADLTISGYENGLYVDNTGVYGATATQTLDITGLASIANGNYEGSNTGVSINNAGEGVPAEPAGSATQTVNLIGDGFTVSGGWDGGIDLYNIAEINGSAHQMVYIDGLAAVSARSSSNAVEVTNLDFGSSSETAEQHLTITGQDLAISSDNGDGIYARNNGEVGGTANQYLTVTGIASISTNPDAAGDGVSLHNQAGDVDSTADQTVVLTGNGNATISGGHYGVAVDNYGGNAAAATQTVTVSDFGGGISGDSEAGVAVDNSANGGESAATQTVTLDNATVDSNGDGVTLYNYANNGGVANQYVDLTNVTVDGVPGIGLFVNNYIGELGGSAHQDVDLSAGGNTIVNSGGSTDVGIFNSTGENAVQNVDLTGSNTIGNVDDDDDGSQTVTPDPDATP